MFRFFSQTARFVACAGTGTCALALHVHSAHEEVNGSPRSHRRSILLIRTKNNSFPAALVKARAGARFEWRCVIVGNLRRSGTNANIGSTSPTDWGAIF
jgi:hypothetical protein